MTKIIILVVVVLSKTLIAAPFNRMDARSLAMGGVGVASSKPSNAARFNPALLSHSSSGETFGLSFPNLSMTFNADPQAVRVIKDLQGAKTLNAIANAFRAIPSATGNTIAELSQSTTKILMAFNDDLIQINGKPFSFNGSGTYSIGIPRAKIGVGFYSNIHLAIETSPLISHCDIALFNGYIQLLNRISNYRKINVKSYPVDMNCAGQSNNVDLIQLDTRGALQILNPATAKDANGKPLLQSSVQVAGLILIEEGLSFSTRLDYKHFSIAIGILPKYRHITSLYANPDIHDIDSGAFEVASIWSKYRKSQSSYNLDAGIAVNLLKKERLTLGLVINNIFSETLKTRVFTQTDGDQHVASINLGTQIRAGASLKLPWGFSLAGDIDLTENKPYFNGISTQYLSLGYEFDFYNALRLRSGGRINLRNVRDRSLTLGVGINLIALHFDLAAQLGDNNAGIAAQLGIAF